MNHLKYWSNVSAVITIAITSLAFLVSILPNALRTFYRFAPINLVDLHSSHSGRSTSAVISNRSSNNVFVSHFMFRLQRDSLWGSDFVYINETLEPGEFFKKTNSGEENSKLKLRPIQSLSNERFLEEIDFALENEECYEISIENELALLTWKLHSDEINTMPAVAYVFYIPSYSNNFGVQKFEVDATLGLVLSEDCKTKHAKRWQDLEALIEKGVEQDKAVAQTK